MDIIDIGGRVKARRLELGLTQGRVAELAGTSRARVEALENGRAIDIGFKRLRAILNALRLDLVPTEMNAGRPTLEDLSREEESNAPRLDR